jgi:hypothetical protein
VNKSQALILSQCPDEDLLTTGKATPLKSKKIVIRKNSKLVSNLKLHIGGPNDKSLNMTMQNFAVATP